MRPFWVFAFFHMFLLQNLLGCFIVRFFKLCLQKAGTVKGAIQLFLKQLVQLRVLYHFSKRVSASPGPNLVAPDCRPPDCGPQDPVSASLGPSLVAADCRLQIVDPQNVDPKS